MPGDTPDEFEAELSAEIDRQYPQPHLCNECLRPVNERPDDVCPSCAGALMQGVSIETPEPVRILRSLKPRAGDGVYQRIKDSLQTRTFELKTVPGSAFDNLNTRHEKMLTRLRALRNTAEGNAEHMSRVDPSKYAIHGFYAQSIATTLDQDWEEGQRARTTPARAPARPPTREEDFTVNGVPLTPGTAAALIHAIENVRTRESVAVLTSPASPENDRRQDDYDRLGQVIGVLRQAFGLEASEPISNFHGLEAERVRDEEEI